MVFEKTKFNSAISVWPKGLSDEMNISVAFKAECEKGELTLRLCAQNTYQLYINGALVMWGPARAGKGFFRVDEIDISNYLTRDKNELLVLVSSYRCANFYLINQAPFFCAELIGKNGVTGESGSDFWSAYRYTQKPYFSDQQLHYATATAFPPPNGKSHRRCEQAEHPQPPKPTETIR